MDLAQPKENNVETAINSTSLPNYVDFQELTFVNAGQHSKRRMMNANRAVSQMSQITAML